MDWIVDAPLSHAADAGTDVKNGGAGSRREWRLQTAGTVTPWVCGSRGYAAN
jgi:hypothetical protein